MRSLKRCWRTWTCPRCNGDGVVQRESINVDEAVKGFSPGLEPCPQCEGSGIVDVDGYCDAKNKMRRATVSLNEAISNHNRQSK